MKVAVFTDIYAPWGSGGIASSIKAQKDELERLGHEVMVFCPGFAAREKNVINVPTHKHLKINATPLALRPEVIEQFVVEKIPDFGKFDIVHVHYEGSCSIAGVRLAKRFNIPLVQTLHGREDMAIAINVPHPVKTLVAWCLNRLHGHYLPSCEKIKRDKYQAPTLARAKMWEIMVRQAECADIVLAPSDHFAKKLEHYGIARPIIVVSNGISAELVTEEFCVRELEDGEVLKMIWNSRVSNEKRILPFLRALTLIKRPYVLQVYGDGNALKKAQNLAKKHQLKVKFYGVRSRDKIIDKMAKSHLGIMASYNFDTQGMTLLEAEATGLPVFFCDPAMMEVVPEKSFVLAGGPEAEAMAIALEKIPAQKIAQMSKQMLKHRDEVLQSTQIKRLLKAYLEARKLAKQNCSSSGS